MLPPEVEDPECLGINKEPAHATLMPYANLKEALAARRQQSSFYRGLNGNWKFNWVEHPAERTVDFYRVDYNDSAWDEIPVPSCWQLLGYGTPYYRNAGYILQKDWPRVMTEPPTNFTAYVERNPVGSYRREFEVPRDWIGRRTFICFDGVDAGFFLWINGEKVGYSVNSRNAAEFDITKYLKSGKNLVAVEVYRFTAGTYLEDQDMWRLSGIIRNVTLWSAPVVHIRDFFVKTDLDENYRDASLLVSAKVKNYSSQSVAGRQLTVELFDVRRKSIGKASVTVPPLDAGEEAGVVTSLAVKDPLKWTAETPNLYTTVLTLNGVAGRTDEILSTKTGFREVEIKGRVFTINGVPVKLKGANRHENWPDTGHYVSEERMVSDIKLLKQGNCNHVRTCHYSDDPRWYELCDEYGLYLNAEANIECHGYYGVLDREPKYEKAIVDRNVANVESFKNHASVVMWSLGNECGGGTNFVVANRAVKAIDGSRPTHYEPFGLGANNPADIDSRMYPRPESVENAATNPIYTKSYYLCEYAHAMFNSMGSIGDYNDIIDRNPNVMGAAIWEWQDQGIWNRRDTNRQFLAYGGGFGEFPNDHYFIHKGVVFSEREPKPHYPEMKRVYQWISIEAVDLAAGKVKVWNRYAFVSLQGFAFGWTLSEDGAVIRQGTMPRLELVAGAEQVVTVPFKAFNPKPGAVYHLRLAFTLAQDSPWASKGFEVAARQFELPFMAKAESVTTGAMPSLEMADDAAQVTVWGKGFEVQFAKDKGTIKRVSIGGKSMLLPDGGPRLHLWRAAHRNDDMWAYKEWQAYGLDDLKWSVVRVSATQVAPSVIRVETVVRGEGRRNFSVVHVANFTIYGDGSIVVDNALTPSRNRIPLARLGVRLELERQYDEFSYLGRGPMENYADRKRGADVGFYSSSVAEQMTPYAKPMECGNHEDVRWAALSGTGLPTLMVQAENEPVQVSALPYTDEVMHPIEYSVDLPPSAGTVLTVAAKTLGVGSAGCGPRPLEQYMVRSEPATFTYILRLIPAGKVPLAEIGRVGVPDGRVKAKPEAMAKTNASPSGKVIAASSFEPGEGVPENAVDGDLQSFWHSHWSGGGVPAPPHFLVIDYGKPQDIAGVVYAARSDHENGHVKDFEVYLSYDGEEWGGLAVKGRIPRDAAEEIIRLPKVVTARYVKFVILSEQNNSPFASVGELELLLAPK